MLCKLGRRSGETVFQRKARGRYAGVHPQFVVDGGQVGVDRTGAQEELFSDLSASEPFDNQPQYPRGLSPAAYSRVEEGVAVGDSSSERAYSIASSRSIARPCASASSHAASPDLERAVAR
jgi:hypothetical protein